MKRMEILKILTLSLAITFLLPTISFAQSNTLSIPLYDSHLSFDILKDAKSLQFAPDYNANITITPLSYQVVKNDNVAFKISIRDTGTIQMKQSYYYVFLVDNDGNVVSTFPDSSNLIQNSYSEFTQWQVSSPCNFPPSNPDKTMDTITQDINGTFWYISRNALLSSSGWMYYVSGNACDDSIQSIIFTGKTSDDLGTWKIYVVVFDAQSYCTRNPDGSLSCNGYYYSYGNNFQRKVALDYNEFQVIAQSNTPSNSNPTTETNPYGFLDNPWIIGIGTAVIAGIILYFLFGRKKDSNKLNNSKKTTNQKQKGKEIYGVQAEKIGKVNININHNRKRRK